MTSTLTPCMVCLQPLGLLKSELLQLIDHKPATEVELYLVRC